MCPLRDVRSLYVTRTHFYTRHLVAVLGATKDVHHVGQSRGHRVIVPAHTHTSTIDSSNQCYRVAQREREKEKESARRPDASRQHTRNTQDDSSFTHTHTQLLGGDDEVAVGILDNLAVPEQQNGRNKYKLHTDIFFMFQMVITMMD